MTAAAAATAAFCREGPVCPVSARSGVARASQGIELSGPG